MPSVVTFDAGQTLVELDLDFLARRLAERDVVVAPAALPAALPAAWRRYDERVAAGAGHPWQALMTCVLEGAGVRGDAIAPLVAWLWAEQPRANLWRKPVPGMIELARELAARGAIVGVVSNSEGRLAELFAEIGIADAFAAILDSGRIGIEKPDPRIFAAALDALGAPGAAERAIHIGDSWAADVCGARAAGWRAVWFVARDREAQACVDNTAPSCGGAAGRERVPAVDDPRVAVAHDAAELRVALAALGAG